MDVLFIIALGFLMPAIAFRSLRAKLILFINAFLVIQKILDITEQVIKDNQLDSVSGGINFFTIMIIPILVTTSVLYFAYGTVKLLRRWNDLVKLFKTKKHDFSIVRHFKGPLDSEEKMALVLSWPGILLAMSAFLHFVGLI